MTDKELQPNYKDLIKADGQSIVMSELYPWQIEAFKKGCTVISEENWKGYNQ